MKKLPIWGAFALGIIALNTPAIAQAPDVRTGDTIETVVVTAEKRTERLQDVPLDVDVVSQDQLERQNIVDTSSLTAAVPSLTLAGGGFGGLRIRGIGTSTFARSAESSVSIVADGVALDRNRNDELFDVDHVEVLNGPQGMLFGKNASAGVVNIVTKSPDLSQFYITGHAEYGEHDDLVDRLTLNAPLTDNLGLRISAHYNAYGRTIYNSFLGKWDYNADAGVRARLLWNPSESLSVNIVADYDRATMNGVAGAVGPLRYIYSATGNAFGPAPAPARTPPDLTGAALTRYNNLMSTLSACGVTVGANNNRVCEDGVNSQAGGLFYPSEFYLLSGQVDWSLGAYTLTSITAERRLGYGNGQLAPGTPGNDADSVPSNILSSNLSFGWQNTVSEELRIASPADQRVSFVAGLYAQTSQGRYGVSQSGTYGITPLPVPAPAIPTTIVNNSDSINVQQQNYALFGQATVKLIEGVRLILGGRETHDLVKDIGIPFSVVLSPLPTCTPLQQALVCGPIASLKYKPVNATDSRANFSWRAGLQYDINDAAMVYFTVAQGFKGALINDQLPSNAPATVPVVVKPEIPIAFELGLKASLLDGKLAGTVALFHNHVKNFQTTVFAPGTPNSFPTGNAPFVTAQGIDISLFGRPLESLLLSGGLIYNDAQYSPGFLVACAQTQTPGSGTCSSQGTTSSTHNLVFAPVWKTTLSGQYDIAAITDLTAFVQADLVYTSRYFYSPTPDPNLIAPGFTRIGARLGLRSNDTTWTVSVFGRNLLDERIPLFVAADPLAASNGAGRRSYIQSFDANSYRVVGIALDGRW